MFPEGGRADAANLGRYVVKHLACRMVDDGLTVPQSFIDFLDGSPEPLDVRLVFVSSPDLYRVIRRASRTGDDVRGVGMLDAFAWIDSRSGVVTGYSSALLVGHPGIGYEWLSQAGSSEVFFATPRPVVYRSDAWRTVDGERLKRSRRPRWGS